MCLFQAEQLPLVRFECAPLLEENQALAAVQVLTAREGVLGPGLEERESRKEEDGRQNSIRKMLDVPSEDLAGERNGRLSKFECNQCQDQLMLWL